MDRACHAVVCMAMQQTHVRVTPLPSTAADSDAVDCGDQEGGGADGMDAQRPRTQQDGTKDSSCAQPAGMQPVRRAPWGLLGTYRRCCRKLPVYKWLPGVNLVYELLDEPVPFEQYKTVSETLALVCALLLNVVLTVPLSLTRDELNATNKLFGFGGPMHNFFASTENGDKLPPVDRDGPVTKWSDLHSSRVRVRGLNKCILPATFPRQL